MFPHAFSLLAGIAGLAALLVLHFAVWGRVYRPRLDSDALLTAIAADGWRLAIAHFRAVNPKPNRLPVILCHGLAANRMNLMLPGEHSLAAFLRARGHDVFVCDLRGAGDSRHAPPGLTARDIDFDRHVYGDAPAILSTALEVTGAPRAFWVGHSMGGLVGLAVAQTEHADEVAGVVALGSPTHFAHHHPLLGRLLPLTFRLGLGGRIHQRWLVRLVAPYLYVRYVLGSIVLNPRNIDGPLLRRVAYLVMDDVSVSILRQFEGWMRRDAWDTHSPTRDLRAGLAQIHCPVLLIAGSADALAPPAAVQTTLAELGTTDKVLRVAGKAAGAAEEYGHGDLIFGRTAPRDVFPAVAEWIEAREPS